MMAVEKYTKTIELVSKLNMSISKSSLDFGHFFLVNDMLLAKKLLELFKSFDLSINNIFPKEYIQLNRHQLIGFSEFRLKDIIICYELYV